MTFEIIDEAGNVHGPFSSQEEIERYVDSRALGEQQRDPDDEREGGWCLCLVRNISPAHARFSHSFAGPEDVYRDQAYVENECRSLAKQIAAFTIG